MDVLELNEILNSQSLNDNNDDTYMDENNPNQIPSTEPRDMK